MKKIFFWLLKLYSKNEIARWEIHKILNEQVSNTYNEQTTFGNVYNAHTEFIMANEFIKKLVKENDILSINMIESGLLNAYKKSIVFIKNEQNN